MNDPMKQNYKNTFDKIEVPEQLLDRTLAAAFQPEHTPQHSMPGSRKFRPALIAAMITVVILGAAAVYASVAGLWSRGLSGTVHSGPKSQQELVDQGFAFPLADKYQELAVTCSGVTITPNMILTDGRIAYVSFLVEGYDYEIGKEERPAFASDYKDSSLQSIRDGKDPEKEISVARIFMDGFYAEKTTDGGYRDVNGNLEYIVKVMTTEGEYSFDNPYDINPALSDSLYGSVLHFEFQDLGTVDPEYDKTTQDGDAYKNVAEGTWTFDITMPDQEEAADMIRTVDLNSQIEDTDCFMKSVEISPISVKLTYTVSRPKNKRGGENAFAFHGIRLKDGTVQKQTAWDWPVLLYGDSENERTCLIALDHVVDPRQAEALLVNLYAYEDEMEIRLR
ncbi:MAG: DUF4179 domain-containing protein [Parasporobacterium sp.]|nr:DUF4179 domain-containing protein [Parasporobacterium sp.]